MLFFSPMKFDPAKATALSKKLPDLDCQGQDVDALESSNWIMGTKVIKKATKVEPSPGSKAGSVVCNSLPNFEFLFFYFFLSFMFYDNIIHQGLIFI